MTTATEDGPRLTFPPYPPLPPNVKALSYALYEAQGLRIKQGVAGPSRVTDYHGNPLVTITPNTEAKPAAPSVSSVGYENAWKIGDEDSDWVEPPATSIAEYDESIPAFTRVMTAVTEFNRSRMQAFGFMRYKKLFNEMRSSFGLNTKFVGHHRPGKGEHAQPYMYISIIRHEHPEVMEGDQEESCVFLAKMVSCVRGFLSLARREAEAGWTVDPAVELARITAAFLAFIAHYKVLPEAEYADDLRASLTLARSAARYLRLAKEFEDAVMDKHGANQVCWALWGGSYDSVERGGKAASRKEVKDEEDDGGWTVAHTPFRADIALSHEQAATIMHGLLPNKNLDNFRLFAYIPFSRRKVIAIDPFPSPFSSTHVRVRTVAAPWTPDEAWKYHHHDTGTPAQETDREEEVELETEKQFGDEPDIMDIWVDGGHDWTDGVGMGLRGRWALVGESFEQAWWIFRARDYVLPAYWQPHGPAQ